MNEISQEAYDYLLRVWSVFQSVPMGIPHNKKMRYFHEEIQKFKDSTIEEILVENKLMVSSPSFYGITPKGCEICRNRLDEIMKRR